MKGRGKLPPHMCAGFAAYILFTKPVAFTNGEYYGMIQDRKYKIDDADAAFFYTLWSNATAETIAQKVLSDASLWGTDLTAILVLLQWCNIFCCS
jgi:tagaturonate reductase